MTSAGYLALLSSPWYLNVVSYGALEDLWADFYSADPQNFTGTEAQRAKVIGGELSIWGEWVDATNLLTTTWPRASPVAERLWSQSSVTDVADAQGRLEEHRCRLIARDIPARALGPSFCAREYVPSYTPPWGKLQG